MKKLWILLMLLTLTSAGFTGCRGKTVPEMTTVPMTTVQTTPTETYTLPLESHTLPSETARVPSPGSEETRIPGQSRHIWK